MKISEVIAKLEEIKKVSGDKEVKGFDRGAHDSNDLNIVSIKDMDANDKDEVVLIETIDLSAYSITKNEDMTHEERDARVNPSNEEGGEVLAHYPISEIPYLEEINEENGVYDIDTLLSEGFYELIEDKNGVVRIWEVL